MDAALNLDAIFEILSRSSLQTIGKCRLLSKICNSLTYETLFMNLHSQRTNTISGYFVQALLQNRHYSTFVSSSSSDSNPNLSLDFLPCKGKFIKIEASTNQGILLCVDDSFNSRIPRYYICKPSTQQWREIPNPKTRYFTETTGMVLLRTSNPLRFKIVRFSRPKYSYSCKRFNILRAETFDSKEWAWKQINDLVLQKDEFLTNIPPVSASGSLHWLTSEGRIFSFRHGSESYAMFSLPEQVCYEDTCRGGVRLVEYEGKLGVICSHGGGDCELKLWVMEDYERKVWKMRREMSVEAAKKEEPYATSFSFYGADVAMMKAYYKLIFCNLKSGSTDVVRVHNLTCSEDIYPYRSDFEVVNFRCK